MIKLIPVIKAFPDAPELQLPGRRGCLGACDEIHACDSHEEGGHTGQDL